MQVIQLQYFRFGSVLPVRVFGSAPYILLLSWLVLYHVRATFHFPRNSEPGWNLFQAGA